MKLNSAAVTHIRSLIKGGHVDADGAWSFDATAGDELLGADKDWGAYGAAHLGIDESANKDTKDYYGYPVAKRDSAGQVVVYLTGLRAAVTRAAQQGETDIADACRALLQAAEDGAGVDANSAVGICSVTIDPANPDEIQLTPDGVFSARDGRPAGLKGWIMNAANASTIIADASKRQTPFVIDYEHQTLRTSDNGQPAPAAGWFMGSNLEYRPGRGLFATKVDWTARARQMITAKPVAEYRFISPVLLYSKTTGDVRGILNAAVTNSPAIDGMDEILARAAASLKLTPIEELTVNWKEKLIALLGLKADVTDAALQTAIEGVVNDSKETAKLKNELKLSKDEVAALKTAGAGEPDPKKYVSMETFESLKSDFAKLNTRLHSDEVDDLIEAAMNDERGPLLLETQREWAQKLGRSDIEGLKAYLKTATPLAARRGRQTAGRRPPEGGAPIDAEGVAILTGLGLGQKDIDKLNKPTEAK